MKHIIFIIPLIFIISCSSSIPDTSIEDEKLKNKKRADKREKTSKLIEEFEEEIGESKENEKSKSVKNKNDQASITDIQISDSSKYKEREIKKDEEKYRWGEYEGEVYEFVLEKSKEELIMKIKQFISSKKSSAVSEVNGIITDNFRTDLSSGSMMKLYNLKSINLKPKMGTGYRVLSYILNEDLKKSDDDVKKEVVGILKEAESTELLKNSIYEVIPQYYKAFLKSNLAIDDIKYNSNNLGEVSAKNYAEKQIRKYLSDIKINIESIDNVDKEDQFKIVINLTYLGIKVNNVKVKTEAMDYRDVKDGEVNLFAEYNDLSEKTIEIELDIAPTLQLSETDFLNTIEKDFGIQNSRSIDADFSSFLKLDFTVEKIKENVIKFIPVIKHISVLSFDWKFSDKMSSTDNQPLKILPPNFKDLTIEFTLNENDEFKVVKKLLNNYTLVSIKKLLFTSNIPPTTTINTPPAVPVPDVAPSVPSNPTEPVESKISNEKFNSELAMVKSGGELKQLIDNLKKGGFLVYSTKPNNFGNLETCYLIAVDNLNKLHILIPGKEVRTSIKGEVMNINSVNKIIYYIKLIN